MNKNRRWLVLATVSAGLLMVWAWPRLTAGFWRSCR
jgi:hypothetical protein